MFCKNFLWWFLEPIECLDISRFDVLAVWRCREGRWSRALHLGFCLSHGRYLVLVTAEATFRSQFFVCIMVVRCRVQGFHHLNIISPVVQAGIIHDNSTGDVANDHYHRYQVLQPHLLLILFLWSNSSYGVCTFIVSFQVENEGESVKWNDLFLVPKHFVWRTAGGYRTNGGSGCPQLSFFDCMAAHFPRFFYQLL